MPVCTQPTPSPASKLAVVAAGALCVLHFASFDITTTPLVTDVRYYVYFAWRIAEGAVPHLDFFGNKTQLAAFFGGGVMRLAREFGGDPLVAVRVSFLGLAAAAGFLSFFIFRALGRGRAAAGLLGVLAYCSFPLLGLLPAIGVLPKLLTAVMASAAVLCSYHRRWISAGVCSALAFMDWQVGGLAGLAVLVAAWCDGEGRRAAVLKVLGGGLAGVAPFAIYYAVHGALGQTLHEILAMALHRGSTSLSGQTLWKRLGRIDMLAEGFGSAPPALFYLGVLGIPIGLFRLWVKRQDDATRLLLPLVLFHVGILAFSAVDFALFGDFFILLHSVAFFLGITWLALYERVLLAFPGETARRRAAFAILLLVGVLARPGFLRPEMVVESQTAKPDTLLADQREVAAQIEGATGGKRVAYLYNIEIAYLRGYVNPIPAAYWNSATWGNFREAGETSSAETAARLIASVDPDAFVASPRLRVAERMEGYKARTFASGNGRYSVTLHIRKR
jgi:hypothetical protein